MIVGIQSAHGETAASFLGDGEADELAGAVLVDSTSQNPLWTARWFNGFSLSRTLAVNLGLSGVTGPNRTDRTAQTHLGGFDVFLKWQPTDAYRGWPFLSLQAEAMIRRYEIVDSSAALDDWGTYVQGLWGFTQGWIVAVRYGYADGTGPSTLEFDQRHRASANLTYFPTEFAKLRLQYNFDSADNLARQFAHAVWLQFEFALGSHAAHTF